MSELSLQERLAKFLKSRHGKWFPKGTLCELAHEAMGVTGESVGRRLRVLHEASSMTPLLAQRTSPEHVRALELLEGGAVLVDYREKKHAWYSYKPPAMKRVRKVKIENGRAVEYYEIINT